MENPPFGNETERANVMKNHFGKSLMAGLLTAAMLLSLLPAAALTAYSETEETSEETAI